MDDLEAFYEAQRFRSPCGRLNTGSNEFQFSWAGHDRAHPMPRDWLEQHAAKFHFTDDELRDARQARNDLPAGSGIYFLYEGSTCIYVGKASGLSARVAGHWRNGRRWDGITWLEVPEVHMGQVEAYYIHRMRPIQNVDYPYECAFSSIIASRGLDCPTPLSAQHTCC